MGNFDVMILRKVKRHLKTVATMICFFTVLSMALAYPTVIEWIAMVVVVIGVLAMIYVFVYQMWCDEEGKS